MTGFSAHVLTSRTGREVDGEAEGGELRADGAGDALGERRVAPRGDGAHGRHREQGGLEARDAAALLIDADEGRLRRRGVDFSREGRDLSRTAGDVGLEEDGAAAPSLAERAGVGGGQRGAGEATHDELPDGDHGSYHSSMTVRRIVLTAVLASGSACVARADAPAPTAPAAPAATMSVAEPAVQAVAQPPAASPHGGPAGGAPAGGKKLTLAEARRYMVQLINRDRASMGLPPVQLDEGAATRAGQAHAEDMARSGYLGHWGTDGSVPEQRYTEAGGADMVLENASCFTDERKRVLDGSAHIDAKNVEQAEDMFFHEQPPHDGHRKNILKSWHQRVGIGVAQPVATPTEIPVPCFAQEFVDPFGTYAAAPRSMRVGETLHVEGAVAAPATFAGVGLARVDAPRPVPVAELNQRRSYPVPAPYQMYWPPGFQTPIPVRVSGARFAVDLPVTDGGKPGMYELSVWGSVPGTKDLVMVSLRTIQVH